jgi:hypothetical protein
MTTDRQMDCRTLLAMNADALCFSMSSISHVRRVDIDSMVLLFKKLSPQISSVMVPSSVFIGSIVLLLNIVAALKALLIAFAASGDLGDHRSIESVMDSALHK